MFAPGFAPGFTPGGISADMIIASLAPTFWLDAGYGITKTGTAVDSWTDRAAGLVLTPNAGATKGTFSASDANYAGRPSVTFTDYGVENATTFGLDASFTYVVITVPTSAAGTYTPIFQRGNARLYSRLSTTPWGAYATTDSSSTTTLSAGTVYGLITLASAANDITFRTNGTGHTANTGSAYLPNTLNTVIGGWFAAAQHYDGSLALSLYWDRLLSGGELALLSSATQRKWGISL